jgi:hypothetical protein
MDCTNGFFFIFAFLSRTNRRRRLNTRRRRQKYNAPILSGNVLNNAGAPLPSSDDNRRVFPRRRDFLPTVYQNNGVRRRQAGRGDDKPGTKREGNLFNRQKKRRP